MCCCVYALVIVVLFGGCFFTSNTNLGQMSKKSYQKNCCPLRSNLLVVKRVKKEYIKVYYTYLPLLPFLENSLTISSKFSVSKGTSMLSADRMDVPLVAPPLQAHPPSYVPFLVVGAVIPF